MSWSNTSILDAVVVNIAARTRLTLEVTPERPKESLSVKMG